jgi:DNA helicase-2/ATP-dependent DNA helicase PcrA
MSGPSLNAPQRTAVNTLSGPLLVLAGAGTGKTRVITYRIAALIKSGIQPSRILAVTFTNKAAKEMRERASTLLGGRKRRNQSRPEISTFHSLCVRVLRRHAEKLGYPPTFTIYDRGDQESVARSALRDIRVGHEKLRPGDLIHAISTWKGSSVAPDSAEEGAEDDKKHLAALAYRRYQEHLRASGAMDFDDLLLKTEELFSRFPEARFAEATRFDHLLIDEYQDTNGLQYRIVRSLAERHRNLCVVGDDDQSIYGWRGAEVTHILSFQRDWPEAKVVRLEDNYRSRSPILALANTLIAHNANRHDKVLRPSREGGEPPRFVRFEDESAEAESLVLEIARRIEPEAVDRVSPSDIAILFRTNEQPRAFELELRRARVPYQLIGGLSFYDRKEIRDVLAYLKVLANPADEVSLLRILNTPPRGIGTSTVEALVSAAVAAGEPLWNVLPRAEAIADVPYYAVERVEAFRGLIEQFRARLGQGSLAELTRELVAKVEYKKEIERSHKNPGDVESRWQSVEELVNAVAQYEQRADQPSLLAFLEDTALNGREDQKDDDKKERKLHAVTLMTLHSAKGLEFPHVYMVGMEEGLLPHGRSIVDGRSIDEERRLCYVGVTRAKETLTLTLCKGRMKWGKLRPQIPSRFLMEMRGETEKARRVAEAAEKLFRGEAPGEAAPEDKPDRSKRAAAGRGTANRRAPEGKRAKETQKPRRIAASQADSPGVEPKASRTRARAGSSARSPEPPPPAQGVAAPAEAEPAVPVPAGAPAAPATTPSVPARRRKTGRAASAEE